ncbi:MAG: VOC family protein [Rhodocyclaceae bacterium]|nr:VOC family protein [Rhodocyclaceae bacterium]MBX3670046.1 VOC family protein [Rhodocyclaceae bacterium]
MTYLPGKFVWYEHMSSDVERARSFYGALFGWTSDPIDMAGTPYHMIQNDARGIGGFRPAEAGGAAMWMSYMSVEDVDAAVARAAALGAQVLLPPTEFPPVGRGAMLADPQGAVFSVWRSAEGDPPACGGQPGDWCWNELVTPDDLAALSFYEQAFGYGHSSRDMGDFVYHLLTREGGAMCGGLMRTPPGAPPQPYWTPYVAVQNADMVAARAAELGGMVCFGPEDIPDVGRFAVLADPLRVVFAILQPMMPPPAAGA